MSPMTIRTREACTKGLKAGLKTGIWISKMMIPITLGVALLKWAGVVDLLTEWLSPLFRFVGLTGEGVMVFLTGALSSLYSAIAVMATLNVDYRSALILAVMGLICHNLIVETVIQRKSGTVGWVMATLRVGMAMVAAWGLNSLLPSDYTGTLIIEQVATTNGTLTATLTDWGWGMVKLLPIMFCLIVFLNVLQELLREYKLIESLTKALTPLMKIFGLPRCTSFLWIVLNTLGLAYGGAVMISELEQGEIEPRAARMLNTHVAITHSLLEDTFIFLAIGLPLFWLVVPRVVLSMVAVWSERAIYYIKDSRK
ncbi:MAG: hypothetical protein RR329_02610 [Mucinivorans sp.]